VRKSNGNLAANGTLYWYMTPGVVAESDLAGTLKSEYVFFDGERAARRDGATGTGGVFYYFSDQLKTASVITDSAGVIKAESDYYPWGGELHSSTTIQTITNSPNKNAPGPFRGPRRRRTIDYLVRAAASALMFGTPMPVTRSCPGPALKAPLFPLVMSRKLVLPERG
jgi:hypothetical protein